MVGPVIVGDAASPNIRPDQSPTLRGDAASTPLTYYDARRTRFIVACPKKPIF